MKACLFFTLLAKISIVPLKQISFHILLEGVIKVAVVPDVYADHCEGFFPRIPVIIFDNE